MHVLTFLCRESAAAATFLLPGYQHDHIIQAATAVEGSEEAAGLAPLVLHSDDVSTA